MSLFFSSVQMPRADSHLAIFIRPLSMEWLSISALEISFYFFGFFLSFFLWQHLECFREHIALFSLSSPIWLKLSSWHKAVSVCFCFVLFTLMTDTVHRLFWARELWLYIFTRSHPHTVKKPTVIHAAVLYASIQYESMWLIDWLSVHCSWAHLFLFVCFHSNFRWGKNIAVAYM